MITLGELATLLDGTLTGDGTIPVARPAHPDHAGAQDIAVAMTPDLVARLADSPVRAAIVAPDSLSATEGPGARLGGWITVGRPRYALHHITRAFDQPPAPPPGVHPLAVVEPGATLGEGVAIGPFVHIGAGARVGDRARLLAGVTLGPEAEVGADSLLYPGVRIGARCRVGARAIVHSNAVIGADGFSFVTPTPGTVEAAKAGASGGATNTALARIHSLGAVTIGDDVEIGANTCIDRGTLTDTRVGDGTKIDDLVMIGHNVQIGRLCMICAQVGLAGSAVVGNGVVLAGRVGVADHITIGDHAVVGAGSGVGTAVPAGEVWVGYPAQRKDQSIATYMLTRRLKSLFKDVADIKRRLATDSSPAESRPD